MKSFSIKKPILTLSLALSCAQSYVSTGRADELPLQDPAYTFDQTKLDVAQDAFHFLRSYVDYFYLVIQANQKALPTVQSLEGVPGWCVGDAHPENFGMLIQQDGRTIFTMNDMDDSGPCPVGLDLIRLMVSSRLYNVDTKLGPMLDAYLMGLQRQTYPTASAVSDMINKSQKKGTAPNPKKISGQKIIRDNSMNEVSAQELAQIKTVLPAQTELLDVVSTSKIGGGSGGLLRYEILLNNGGSLLHLELKEEVTPAIYPVATEEIPTTRVRIMKTIQMDQTSQPSVFYSVVQINGRDMLVRPRFDGNVGVNLDKQSDSDNQDLIRQEAFALGLIHSRSVGNISAWVQTLQTMQKNALEADVNLLVQQFQAKYSSLK